MSQFRFRGATQVGPARADAPGRVSAVAAVTAVTPFHFYKVQTGPRYFSDAVVTRTTHGVTRRPHVGDPKTHLHVRSSALCLARKSWLITKFPRVRQWNFFWELWLFNCINSVLISSHTQQKCQIMHRSRGASLLNSLRKILHAVTGRWRHKTCLAELATMGVG